MAITRGTAPETLEPWITHIFMDELDRKPEEYSQCFKMDTSDKAFEDYFEVAGFTTFAVKDEGKPIGYDEMVQGPRKRVTFTTFALGFRITEEMKDDEQHGVLKKLPADLADSARDHKEQIAWRVFNLGFGTDFLTVDGVGALNTSHTLLKTGALQSNVLAPAAALDNESLESMLTLIELALDNQGRPVNIMANKLVVPPQLRWQAHKILKSEYEPFTADNTVNVMKESETGLMPFVARYLTSATAWYVLGDDHTVTWYDRKELITDMYLDGGTKDDLYDARYRAAAVVLRHWGFYGSEGTG